MPFFRPDSPAPVPAIVSTVLPQQPTWNRPVFKAPPLKVEPPMADVANFTAEIAKLGRAEQR